MNPLRMKQVLVIYGLFIAVAVVHFPVLLNGLINWNDDELFYAMHAVHAGHATVFSQEQHAPALMWWYGLQYAIGGNGHFIYHAVSLLLHAANVLLLFVLLQRVGLSLAAAGTASALFAFHPINAGTVAMLTGQPVLLTMFFLLLLVLSYHRTMNRTEEGWSVPTLILTVVVALVGAPSLLALSTLLVLHVIHRRPVLDRNVLSVTGIAAVGWIIQGFNHGWWDSFWPLFRESVMMVRYGIVDQATRLFLPWSADLLPVTQSQISATQDLLLMLVPFFVLSAVVAAVLFRRTLPVVFVSTVVILGSTLPLFTGWSRGEWLFSEQTAYIASAAWMVLAVWTVERLMERWKGLAALRWFMTGTIVLVAGALAVQTFVRSGYWRDGGSFWARCLEEQPENVFAYTKKGMYHYFQFEFDQAVRVLDEAVRLAPFSFDAVYSRAVVNLGGMYLPQATRDYQRALELDPRSSNAYFGMGSIHSLYSRFDSAVTAFSRAIELSPGFYEAYTNRATVYANQGRYVEAFADFEKAQRLSPKFGQIFGNRALVSLQTGNAAAAAADLRTQLELEPFNVTARIHAGFTAVLMMDTSGALLQFSKAWEIDSQRTKLYLTGAKQTFLKTFQEQRLGDTLLRSSIGTF